MYLSEISSVNFSTVRERLTGIEVVYPISIPPPMDVGAQGTLWITKNTAILHCHLWAGDDPVEQ